MNKKINLLKIFVIVLGISFCGYATEEAQKMEGAKSPTTRHTTSVSENTHPCFMKIRVGKSELDPGEKLEFKRTDMFDHGTYYTKGNSAYFRPTAPQSQTTQASQ